MAIKPNRIAISFWLLLVILFVFQFIFTAFLLYKEDPKLCKTRIRQAFINTF